MSLGLRIEPGRQSGKRRRRRAGGHKDSGPDGAPDLGQVDPHSGSSLPPKLPKCRVDRRARGTEQPSHPEARQLDIAEAAIGFAQPPVNPGRIGHPVTSRLAKQHHPGAAAQIVPDDMVLKAEQDCGVPARDAGQHHPVDDPGNPAVRRCQHRVVKAATVRILLIEPVEIGRIGLIMSVAEHLFRKSEESRHVR